MPSDSQSLRFSSDHLWADPTDDTLVRVGVTDFAQQSLGDIVSVTPPGVGVNVSAGAPCGEVESTKSLSDLIAPVTGTVNATNSAVADSPDVVNTDPYGRGWIFEVRVEPAALGQQLSALMDSGAYHDLTGQ